MRIRIFLAWMQTHTQEEEKKFQFRALFIRQMILFQLAAATAPNV